MINSFHRFLAEIKMNVKLKPRFPLVIDVLTIKHWILKKLKRGACFLATALIILTLMTSCSLPQVSAQQRVFLDLSLEFLGEYQLPYSKFKDTPVGGLSGLTYDRSSNLFYAIADDRSQFAPARFYTLKLILDNSSKEKIGIKKVEIENVTFLRDTQGNTYPKNTSDTEGIALTPQQTVFISSEGVAENRIPPFIKEFALKTGREQQSLTIPERYIPNDSAEQPRGIQNNLGFEALTLNPTGTVPAKGEPFRLFTVTESALVQDEDEIALTNQTETPQGAKCRLLHYLLSDGAPIIISEHLYQLEPPPSGAVIHGLPDLLSLDQGGHFLALERSFGLLGFSAKIFQAATGGATDTSRIASLKGELRGVEPIKKNLLFDLDKLGIYLDNLEGMAFGPRLPDGSQSLLMVSDNNFNDSQITQFLLFRLKSGS